MLSGFAGDQGRKQLMHLQ